ncbi:Na/Pi cotransporter family protein [Anaeromassilibacillus senegalensis]|uniref:Na/Pi cotransporter family protein n=1 Tax=Anaeromassilibacillus senegalensis TaxID=1673717 RepID=A0ABS9CK00_9FIRM|nr:Na/Pi cotransporter family protein [Anaeromassilibacillus senegalensis]MCF2651147.1 Na/Pi cotransporter family protein [Anaeromassilibacillus senegalensis]MDD7647006.1 Na/Pi cotransporter family protein [Ruminococcus bromii]
MDIFSVITLFGGLAFFLYGMHLLSSSLEKMVGGKLERVLRSMTSNRFKSLLLGMAITIAIQSSSAMTVMLVGLVNSGIMELGQSIGVIMGSNIGTTVTAWILSLSGITSDNVFVQLLKPESFSPIIALIGIILIMFTKSSKKKDIGSVCIGFAILMTGMTLMSGAVKPLADLPQFKDILMMLNNPFVAILAGTLITALIQSSAASLGILQSLAMTGGISFNMALPIIMGQNIGTCITALLSSIGTSKNAKRVTAVHIYFNVLGTVICLSGFYLADAIFHFSFTDQPISSFMIAVVHSAFNLLTTFILLPFCKQLEKLAVLTVRDKRVKPGTQGDHTVLLDERLLLSPSFAIAECRNATVRMANTARDTILDAIGLLSHFDEDVAKQIEKNEDKVDQFEDKLGSYLVKISSKNLSHADSNDVSQLLHTIGDFERISDHAVNILRVAREIHDKGLQFSEKAQEELKIFTNAVIEILNITTDAFAKNDLQLAYEVEPLEQVIDSLKVELKNRHVRRLQEGKCTIELGFVLSDILNNYERISDHCSNIAVCMIQIKDSAMDTHGYLNEVKTSGEPRFTGYYNRFTDKYTLPKSSAQMQASEPTES